MRGTSIKGKASELIDTFLLDKQSIDAALKMHGIVDVNEFKASASSRNSPLMAVAHYVRQHREIDVTSYGDATQQTMILSPGLDLEIEHQKVPGERELRIALMLFLNHEQHAALARKEQYILDLENAARKRDGDLAERDSAILALWDTMGKKRRARLAMENPAATRIARGFAKKRDRERRYEEYDTADRE